MLNYKDLFRSFLEKHEFLPLHHWKCFKLEHGKKAIFRSNLVKIRKEVDNKSGIYIYEKGKRILYVGKAVSLFSRIKSHNRESFESVPGDTKWNTWHKFFSKNKGKVQIYWKEVNTEGARIILEKMLQCVLEPEFYIFRKKIEKNK